MNRLNWSWATWRHWLALPVDLDLIEQGWSFDGGRR